MKLTLKLGSIILLMLILLTACSGTAATPVSVDMTAGVNTMVASFFGTQTAQAATVAALATVTFTPVPPTATYTLPPSTALPSPTIVYYYPSATAVFKTPTYIPLATGTQFTATVNPSVLGSGCNNLAFIADVDHPSDTEVQPGENFNKTWKVMNNGTCDWKYQYTLEFLSANYPEGGSYKLGRIVTVNDWAEVWVNLDARKNPGTYTSYWRMSDGAGHMFGATLVASYVVKQP